MRSFTLAEAWLALRRSSRSPAPNALTDGAETAAAGGAAHDSDEEPGIAVEETPRRAARDRGAEIARAVD